MLLVMKRCLFAMKRHVMFADTLFALKRHELFAVKRHTLFADI